MGRGKPNREPGSPREPGIARLGRIPIHENGEPLVDLREACPELVLACKLPFVRRSVAAMLCQAARALPDGWRLKVHTALRTPEQQAAGYWKHYQRLAEQHPEWPRNILRREANRFWHPPDMKAPPGHTTGGAVDVRPVDAEGNEIDVTSAAVEGANTQPTYSTHLTPTARKNRQALVAAMAGAGFSNCADEWWHWSYGDSAWAGRTGAPAALYDAVRELPPPVLAELAKLSAEAEAPGQPAQTAPARR
ncbi:MAG: M15 family metallopeptidase [Armatimonadota bacterium]|nr:M15 family metallopeptidase [Armatimonadota bacterium]